MIRSRDEAKWEQIRTRPEQKPNEMQLAPYRIRSVLCLAGDNHVWGDLSNGSLHRVPSSVETLLCSFILDHFIVGERLRLHDVSVTLLLLTKNE